MKTHLHYKLFYGVEKRGLISKHCLYRDQLFSLCSLPLAFFWQLHPDFPLRSCSHPHPHEAHVRRERRHTPNSKDGHYLRSDQLQHHSPQPIATAEGMDLDLITANDMR